MSERVIDVVPGLVSGQKRDGRCRYSAQAKAELVRRCSQPGVSFAATSAGHVELVLPGGTIRLCGRVEAATLALAIDCLARRA